MSVLNDFMEEWEAGNFPNLQYMHIGSDSFHWYWYDQVLGFKRHEMNQVGVSRRLVIDENLSVDCTGGVDIQAVNGIKATMQMDRESRNSFELFILSQCSRKAASCVHFVGSRKWKLSVDVREQRIDINGIYRVVITESSIRPTWNYDRRMKMLFLKYQKSENSKLELQKVFSQLQSAFRCPVTSFEYNGFCKSDQCWVSVLNCIIQNQVQPLESFAFFSRTLETEDLERALQNVKVSRQIRIWIYTSSFIRLDLMMFKSCKCIEFKFSWLTISDLDVFMEEWKAGNLPSLQYMLIRNDSFHWYSYDQILGFKRDEMMQLDFTRRLIIDENLTVWCTGGRGIQAVNGTKATMQMDRESHNSFELFVWNN
ncbi:hypothetical protein CAEBREN_24557 [Caenorhabditis brenneri]|uniref:Sdz-33 F-box domain-containing protein n=1 Tax=Caenorhabditis brenneri TaxID=135651 RepID=G0N2D1_CAEBE|nr:hypothetical protein CAEBREN_24557 [Caenorhabditis brenneri]